jgi:hypothetical protein
MRGRQYETVVFTLLDGVNLEREECQELDFSIVAGFMNPDIGEFCFPMSTPEEAESLSGRFPNLRFFIKKSDATKMVSHQTLLSGMFIVPMIMSFKKRSRKHFVAMIVCLE